MPSQPQVFNPQSTNKPATHHQANHNENRTVGQSASQTAHQLAQDIVATKAPKIGFVSLGCPKALVDSERIITELSRDGYQVASDYDGADLVVVNTCGFIESAVQERLMPLVRRLPKTAR